MGELLDKLRMRGAEGLSDSELLALVMGSAEEGETTGMAARAIEAAGGLAELVRCDFPRLRMTAGMGGTRAARIAAAAEIGRRAALAQAARRVRIESESDVDLLMRPYMEPLKHEECWVLYLSSANEIIERTRVSQGGVQGTVVDCRLVVKRALELLASRMIIVHNHPSGAAEPSTEDKSLTRKIAEAAGLFDIPLLDHIIISRAATYSFKRAGLL